MLGNNNLKKKHPQAQKLTVAQTAPQKNLRFYVSKNQQTNLSLELLTNAEKSE